MDIINVTKTFMPPIEEYEEYLRGIWQRGNLTNQGPLLKEFEEKTKAYLGVGDFQFVSNGTIALQIALSALGITEGEVITTPFSYVATTSAILWERCKPVYVDIDPLTLCIDPDKIEAAITSKTKAIMPVHVFGNACDVEKIDAIAKKHNLRVIYDAAHAFGVRYKGKSILNYGDISICSFHCTKLFHTIEGGCIVTNDTEIREKVELTRRFGHNGDDHLMLGINGKSTEFQAAMGLCNLSHIDGILADRKTVTGAYDRRLAGKIMRPNSGTIATRNYAYYPVIFASEKQLLNVMDALKAQNIYGRRYFYPSLNTLSYVDNNQKCPISEDISRRILCLPLYPDLSESNVERVCKTILQAIDDK